MKKILLTTAALIAISSNAFAEDKPCCHDKAKHSSTYVRMDVLGQKFHKSSVNGTTYKNQNYSYGADFGLGYHLTEKIRAELIYNHNFITRFKNNASKGKADIKAAFARIMFDVISFEKAKFFVGAGAGFARTAYKLNTSTATSSAKYEAKNKNNFAYSLHAGAAMDIVEGVMLEASWGMRNYGATHALTDTKSANKLDKSKMKLRAQMVALGLRFDV